MSLKFIRNTYLIYFIFLMLLGLLPLKSITVLQMVMIKDYIKLGKTPREWGLEFLLLIDIVIHIE